MYYCDIVTVRNKVSLEKEKDSFGKGSYGAKSLERSNCNNVGFK